MDAPTPPPAHVRPGIDEAMKAFEEALKNPSTRKRVKHAAQRAGESAGEMLRDTPASGTKTQRPE